MLPPGLYTGAAKPHLMMAQDEAGADALSIPGSRPGDAAVSTDPAFGSGLGRGRDGNSTTLARSSHRERPSPPSSGKPGVRRHPVMVLQTHLHGMIE